MVTSSLLEQAAQQSVKKMWQWNSANCTFVVSALQCLLVHSTSISPIITYSCQQPRVWLKPVSLHHSYWTQWDPSHSVWFNFFDILLFQVLAVESLLADAVAVSGGLLHTCGGQCNSWSLSQIPPDADLKLIGVPGLKGMVEELR